MANNNNKTHPKNHATKTEYERELYRQNILHGASSGATTFQDKGKEVETVETVSPEETSPIEGSSNRKRRDPPEDPKKTNWIGLAGLGIPVLLALIALIWFLAGLHYNTQKNSEKLIEFSIDLRDQNKDMVKAGERLASLEAYTKIWNDGSESANTIRNEINTLQARFEKLEKDDSVAIQSQLAGIEKRISALELQVHAKLQQ